MTSIVLFLLGIPVLGLVLSSAPLCTAQTDATQQSPKELQRRMQELEAQVNDLRSQLLAMKQSESNSSPATTLPQSNLISGSNAPTVPPGPSLAGLLGPTSLSGFVDMYYNYNSNQPASRANGFRSFDGLSNQFALNLVELVVDKAPEATNSRTGYHIALGFGQAMNAVNGTDPGGLGFDQYLKEAYFSYLAPVGKGLQFDAGKFITPHGAEVIETKDDLNYTRGLLFSYAIPYFHYGLRAKYAFNERYSTTLFMVNGWNNVVENNSGKTYGIGFGWTPNRKVSFTQNYMAGPELAPEKDPAGNNSSWRHLWDTVVSYSPTSKLTFVLNTDYGRGDRAVGLSRPVFWTGAAAYIKYALNDKYALVTRYEYYDDHDGFTTGVPQHFNGITGTLQRMIAGHLLSRLEYRRDTSNQPVFVRGKATPVSAQNTVTAGLVFMFDSREAK